MPDIATVWEPTEIRGDWTVVGSDLAAGDDLETSVLISLFTDRRADADDVIPDGSSNPRGWWGDIGRDEPIGSKLWLLSRAKQTEDTRLRAQDYASAALQWLVDGGIASSVAVVAAWQAPGFLGLAIDIFEPTGALLRQFNYQWAWKGLS